MNAHNEQFLAKEGMTALIPGAPAPPVQGMLLDGSSFDLTTVLAKQRVVFFFYPANDTPNSSRHLQQLSKAKSELELAGIKVVAVCPGDNAASKSYFATQRITLNGLADTDNAIAARYGCIAEGGQYPQRTLVGVNQDGTVAFFNRGFVTAATIAKGIEGLFKPAAVADDPAQTAPAAATAPAGTQPATAPAANPPATGEGKPAAPPAAPKAEAPTPGK